MQTMCRTLAITKDDLIRRVKMAVLTMSSEGSCLYYGGNKHFIPVAPVSCADPTGAGDAYRAGFLSAYAKGHAPLTCCRIGTVTASFVVEHPGCQTHLADWKQMTGRYTRHFGNLPEPDERRF